MSKPQLSERELKENELLVFLWNRFSKFEGRPKQIDSGTETHYSPMGDVCKAVYETAESFSPRFVITLFALLQQSDAATARQASEYGRFYNDPEKTLDELKREHDLKGFNQKLEQPRKAGAKATKDLHQQDNDAGKCIWDSWPNRDEKGQQQKCKESIAGTTKRSIRTVDRWIKEWKDKDKDKA